MKRNFNSGVDSQHGSVESDSRVPFLLILGGDCWRLRKFFPNLRFYDFYHMSILKITCISVESHIVLLCYQIFYTALSGGLRIGKYK